VKKPLKILIAGGGTSGHISPALAVIGALRKMANGDFEPQFLYIGSHGGLENQIIPAHNIPLVNIETGKLRRYLSAENLRDLFRVPVGTKQALRIIKDFAPDVVFSTGGYVAVPAVWAAKLRGVPILMHEQTVQIGLANRLIAPFATRIALSFESARSELSASAQKKAFVSGNPVRASVLNGDAEKARKWCGFDPANSRLQTLYITGGSQGSQRINHAILEILQPLLEQCQVVHQCGQQSGETQDEDLLKAAAEKLPLHLRNRYFVTPFIRDELADVFALSDLVLGRSGAGTVAELCLLGKPAIYIPLVPTGGDEQTRNAQMCKKIGAAEILSQNELTPQILLQQLKVLLSNPPKLEKMSQAALQLAKPNAAQTLAEMLVEMGNKKA
jgi:UDP-N-acetylglucosamine--N-acetylmuramyl-(pentapeptide) pyrophosphoryl-undecaprenol N-acetylglucosamine transferase